MLDANTDHHDYFGTTIWQFVFKYGQQAWKFWDTISQLDRRSDIGSTVRDAGLVMSDVPMIDSIQNQWESYCFASIVDLFTVCSLGEISPLVIVITDITITSYQVMFVGWWILSNPLSFDDKSPAIYGPTWWFMSTWIYQCCSFSSSFVQASSVDGLIIVAEDAEMCSEAATGRANLWCAGWRSLFVNVPGGAP